MAENFQWVIGGYILHRNCPWRVSFHIARFHRNPPNALPSGGDPKRWMLGFRRHREFMKMSRWNAAGVKSSGEILLRVSRRQLSAQNQAGCVHNVAMWLQSWDKIL